MTYHDHLSTNHRNCHYRIVRTCAFHASNIGMSYYGLEHNIWCEYELFFTRGLKQGGPPCIGVLFQKFLKLRWFAFKNDFIGLIAWSGDVLSRCAIRLPKKSIFFILQHFFSQKCSILALFERCIGFFFQKFLKLR